MKLQFTGGGVVALAGVALVAGVAWALWRNRGAIGNAAATAGNLVNPASSGNVVNRAVESVGQTLTGDSSWSLGGLAWDYLHGDSLANELRVKPRAPLPTTGDFARADRIAYETAGRYSGSGSGAYVERATWDTMGTGYDPAIGYPAP